MCASYISNVRITPRLDGSVTFEVEVEHPAPAQFVAVSVRKNGRVLATGMSMADGSVGSVGVQVQEPDLWSPNHPALYEALSYQSAIV